jgi:hypothetical protein
VAADKEKRQRYRVILLCSVYAKQLCLIDRDFQLQQEREEWAQRERERLEQSERDAKRDATFGDPIELPFEKDPSLWHELNTAVLKENIDKVRELLLRGADPHQTNKLGETTYDMARSRGRKVSEEFFIWMGLLKPIPKKTFD